MSRPEDNPADDQYERDLLLAEIARLREAIQEWARWDQSHTAAEGSARIALYMIAREGQ